MAGARLSSNGHVLDLAAQVQRLYPEHEQSVLRATHEGFGGLQTFAHGAAELVRGRLVLLLTDAEQQHFWKMMDGTDADLGSDDVLRVVPDRDDLGTYYDVVFSDEDLEERYERAIPGEDTYFRFAVNVVEVATS